MTPDLNLLLVQVAALLAWLSAWMFILGGGFALVLGIVKAFLWLRRKYFAWRAEQAINNRRWDMRISRGMREAQKRGWLPPDTWL